MGLYRKKLITITAYRLTNDNFLQVAEWCGGQYADPPLPDWLDKGRAMDIPTLEGTMVAHIGDWVAQGVEDEFYPIKHTIFEKTYEAV